MSRRIRLVAVGLMMLSQVAMANLSSAEQSGPAGQVLHFPARQAVGQISVIDASYTVPEISREFHPGYVFTPTQHLGPARGDVRIPPGKCVALHLGGRGVTQQQCIDCLKSLAADDVQVLDFLQPVQIDDASLPHVARLTGLTHFCPVTARFSGNGWSTLQSLSKLEHICTPHELTDAEMAGIATLQMVREMEIVAPLMTDAGLASIARLRNLEVLHLDGTMMMTDDGLKVLAALPKLRHLRLAGPFTDRGLAYLAAAPSLKAMWLETPRATEEGLHSLAKIQSLERLCVPWLDRITDHSIRYLKAMPKLVALGVGDAWSADAGIASLASLTNLEVLAIKGGPNLTDNALKPLAAMPKLRALEIYHSQITEQGLTYLASCRKLDSIEILSSVAISQQAIARLKAKLANVQTLNISQPQTPVARDPWLPGPRGNPRQMQ